MASLFKQEQYKPKYLLCDGDVGRARDKFAITPRLCIARGCKAEDVPGLGEGSGTQGVINAPEDD